MYMNQDYWMSIDGTSYWGMQIPNTVRITMKIHKMPKHLKKCLFFATEWKIG